ncbi:hypothetical protein B0H14DRAFT_3882453 [Mycena olivaceomarginata]|nr:hypothetical protein B0H14DRAFT_3882453 [Mycena olivaceomarginata]
MDTFFIPPAFEWPVQFCIFCSATTYFASIITSNVSQVDRLWTSLPTIYSAYFALLPLWPQQQSFYLAPYTPASLGIAPGAYNPRALMMLSLIVVWMLRLNSHMYRRGEFDLKHEDYRWGVLRGRLHPVLFQILNIIFISGIQHVLLLLLSIPTYFAATQPPQPLNSHDYGIIFLSLLVLVLYFTSDNQQYTFHMFKHQNHNQPYDKYRAWIGARLEWTPADAKRGFLTRGLWAWSRHPNCACEQSFWWIMTIAPLQHPSLADLRSTVLADKFGLNLLRLIAPLTPGLALSTLFFCSTLLTESITAPKYPGYAAYQARVAMFSPVVTGLKGAWLAFTGRKAEVERVVWGKETKEE